MALEALVPAGPPGPAGVVEAARAAGGSGPSGGGSGGGGGPGGSPPDPPPPGTFAQAVLPAEGGAIVLVADKDRPMKIPPELPTAVTFRSWKNAVVAGVIGSSHRSDLAAPWIHKVAKPGTTFEALADSEGFTSLDTELAAGLLQMAKGPIAKRFQILADRAAVADTFLRGRQLLHVIYEHYKIDENQGMVFNITSLTSVKFAGDSKLEQFLSN